MVAASERLSRRSAPVVRESRGRSLGVLTVYWIQSGVSNRTTGLGNRSMSRFAIVLCVFSYVGCSRARDTDAVVGESNAEVVDGGTVENVHRDKVNEYFDALTKIQSVDDEEKLLQEFGEWLTEKGYKIRVEVKNGKHDLSCPYFPPVTPWTSHSFLDVKNLDLLPQLSHRLDHGG